MLKPMLAPLFALCAIAVPLAAQVPTSPIGVFGEKQLDPAQMAALAANSQRVMKPASFVLSHKADLSLNPEQVQRLNLLARGEEDSAVVRQIRLVAATVRLAKKREANGELQSGWVGPVDEKKVREDACEQSGTQVEVMLDLMRDRRAVGNILTGTQIDRLQLLEVGDMRRAMMPKQP